MEKFENLEVEQKLNDIVSTLNGTLQYASTYDNIGTITKKIIITYDETKEKV